MPETILGAKDEVIQEIKAEKDEVEVEADFEDEEDDSKRKTG